MANRPAFGDHRLRIMEGVLFGRERLGTLIVRSSLACSQCKLADYSGISVN